MNVNIEKLPAEELNAPHNPEAEAPTTPAQIGAIQWLDNDEAEDVESLDDISSDVPDKFVPVAFTTPGGKSIRVFVRELSLLQMIDVEAGRVLVRGGQILRAPAREGKVGLSLEVAATVYKRKKSKSEEFEPMFADTASASNWLNKAANKPIIREVLTAIYVVNPELSPEKKIKALSASQK